MIKLIPFFAFILLAMTLTGCDSVSDNNSEPPQEKIIQVDENTWKNEAGRFTNEEGQILSNNDNMNHTNQGL